MAEEHPRMDKALGQDSYFGTVIGCRIFALGGGGRLWASGGKERERGIELKKSRQKGHKKDFFGDL